MFHYQLLKQSTLLLPATARKSYADYGSISYSSSAIAISHNPIQHTRTKHIDIRYHFLKDNVQKCKIELIFVSSPEEIAGVFTKA